MTPNDARLLDAINSARCPRCGCIEFYVLPATKAEEDTNTPEYGETTICDWCGEVLHEGEKPSELRQRIEDERSEA